MMESENYKEKDGNKIIINGVESHPCLYNKHLKDYKNNLKRKRAWQEITDTYAEMTGERESVDTIKARWAGLRSAFGKEYNETKKYIPSGSGATENSIPEWLYYSDCLFLTEHIRHRRMDENFKFSDDEVDENDDQSNEEKNSKMSQQTESDSDEEQNTNLKTQPSSSNAPDNAFDLGAEIASDEKEVLKKGQEIPNFIKFLSNNENKNKLFGYEKIIVDNFRKLSEEDKDEVFDPIMDIIEAKLNAKPAEIPLD